MLRLVSVRCSFRNLRFVQVASYADQNPEMVKDPFLRKAMELKSFDRAKGKPFFDQRNRYHPEFWQTIEMFMDHNIVEDSADAPESFWHEWNCQKDQGPIDHWTKSKNEDGVTRVVMNSPSKLPCHVEIYWDHYFLIAYQHDPIAKRERLIEKEVKHKMILIIHHDLYQYM
jgi:hypothetical protein